MKITLTLLLCFICWPVHRAENLKAVVRMDPDFSPVFRGEHITLKCNIQGELSRATGPWVYSWYYDYGDHKTPIPEYDSTILSIGKVQINHNNTQYKCSASTLDRSEPPLESESFKLLVFEIPRATITIQSPQPPFYSGDRVSLRCEVQGNGWEYRWMRNKHKINGLTNQTITLSLPEDAGHYECYGIRRGLSSHHSLSRIISMSALPKPSLTPAPQDPVSTEETVTSGSNQVLVGVAVAGGVVVGVAFTILIMKILTRYRKQRGPVSNSSPVAVGLAVNSNNEQNDQGGLPIYETIQHVAPTRKVMDTVYDKLSLSNMDPSALSNPYELAE